MADGLPANAPGVLSDGTEETSGWVDVPRSRRWVRRGQAWFGAHRAPALIIAFALLTSLPMFWVQLDSDDYFQLVSLSEGADIDGMARAPWDLYAFAKNEATNVALRNEGVWPWWADTSVLIAFFRPLASLSRALDHALFPNSLFLMQLHSLAWFAGLLWVVSRTYARFFAAPWVASVALFAFACDEARAGTLAWLCNRNALISLSFGFAALYLHDRARTDGDLRARWLAPLCFAVGLLGGETALQVTGYLFAYALFLDPDRPLTRLRSLVPYGLIVLAWGIVYKLLGYGARGSGFYVDPIGAPLEFAALVPERLAVYALALFGGVSTDWFDLLPLLGVAPRPFLVPLAAGCVLLVGMALVPLFRRDPLVRFWAVGALIAALPACGVRPSDRMLTGAALGGMALIAQLLASLVERTYPKPTRWWLHALGWLLAFVNLVYAPLLRPYFIVMSNDFNDLIRHADASLPHGDEIADQTIVLLNPPWDTFGIFASLFREANGIARPERLRWLATGVSDLRVERVDEKALKIRPSDGFLATPSQRVLRALDRKLPVGERIALDGVTFEVLSLTEDERPSEVLARFDEVLDAPSLRFMRWGDHGYVPFALPKVGEAVMVPAVDMAEVVRGP